MAGSKKRRAGSKKSGSSSAVRRGINGAIPSDIVVGTFEDAAKKNSNKSVNGGGTNKESRRRRVAEVAYSRNTLRRMLELASKSFASGADSDTERHFMERMTNYTSKTGGLSDPLVVDTKCAEITSPSVCRSKSVCGVAADSKSCQAYTAQGGNDHTTTEGMMATLQELVNSIQIRSADAVKKTFQIPPRHWFDAESFKDHKLIKLWSEQLHALEVENLLPYRCIDPNNGSISPACFQSMLNRLNANPKLNFLGFVIDMENGQQNSIPNLLRHAWMQTNRPNTKMVFHAAPAVAAQASAAAQANNEVSPTTIKDPRYRYISFTIVGGADANTRAGASALMQKSSAKPHGDGNYVSTILIDREKRSVQEFNAHGLTLVEDRNVLQTIWEVLRNELVSATALKMWSQDDEMLEPQHLIAEQHDDGMYHLWYLTERLTGKLSVLKKRMTPAMMRKREHALFRLTFNEEFPGGVGAPVQKGNPTQKSAEEKAEEEVERQNNTNAGGKYRVHIKGTGGIAGEHPVAAWQPIAN